MRRTVPLLASLLVLGSLGPATAAEMAAHRAFYELTMDQQRASGDVVAAQGRMAYEVIDACDGWATRQRLQMTTTNRDGQAIEMETDYVTWELKDGLKLTFHLRQLTDTAVTSETSGEASLQHEGGPGEAKYTLPEATTKPLAAGTLLPMKHTEALLAAARDGKKFFAAPLFDGTSEKGPQDTSVTVLAVLPAGPTGFAPLDEHPSARVHIAFFDQDAGTPQPDYEVGMRYWDNGVADDLKMDFGGFVMDGKMTDFVIMPPGC